MNQQFTKKSKIVILGGGSAGWLTALFINRNYKNTDVVVVEDPSKPPIIAGESGTTTLTDFLLHLKIDKDDFIKRTNATPKLGGKFVDWDGVGTEFIHCLQTDFSPWLEDWGKYINSAKKEELTIGGVRDMLLGEHGRDVYLKTVVANEIPIENIFYSGEFIRQGKVPFGATAELPCIPMWHFESRAAAGYFKELGISRGIKLVEEKFQTANLDNQGNISSILLDNDCLLDGDWFFDCSGFARLLLDKTLKEPIVDYSNIFTADSVVAWWDKTVPTVTTNATSMKYGWSWNINLRHRSGNGYLYSSEHITLDQAINEAEKRFNKKIEPIANFSFKPGMMHNSWKNNVIGVGLSTGFLEPLEANGVAVIIETLYALHDHWDPTSENSEYSKSRFNHRTFSIVDDIKDFLALHYRNHRSDSEFWLDHQNNPKRIPDSLKEKLEKFKLFYENRASAPDFSGYSVGAWLTVLEGLNVFDRSILKKELGNRLELGEKVLNNTKSKYKHMVTPHWTIEEWISNTR